MLDVGPVPNGVGVNAYVPVEGFQDAISPYLRALVGNHAVFYRIGSDGEVLMPLEVRVA